MGKDAPIISKALRLVSFSLTLVTIIIFVTIGISAWQVFQGVLASSENLKMEQRVSQDGIELVIGVNMPNKGVYPLELQIAGESSVNKVKVGRSISGPHVIKPGDTKSIEFVLPLSLAAGLDAEFAKRLLFEDSAVAVNITTRIGFQPFAFVNFSSGFGSQSGAIFSGLKIEQQGVSRFNSTHSLMEMKISYANKSPVPFQGKVTMNIVSTPTRTTRGLYGSTSFDVSTNAGDAVEQTVFMPVRNDARGSGDYRTEILVKAGSTSASTEKVFRGN